MKLSSEDRRHLGLLLSPSWLSGLLAVGIGLLMSVGVIVAFSTNSSTIRQQLVAWQQEQPERPLTTPDQILESDKPTLSGTWPLIIVWSLVGLAVYTIAASIVSSLQRAEAMRESLDYVHAKREAILKEAAEHIALRLVAVGVLIALLWAFFEQVVPYAILAAHASAGNIVSLDGVLYLILSFAAVAVSLHVQTIFLRLSLGRLRVFSQV